MQKVIKKVINLDNNREITIETGKLAKQADGSVVVRTGNTMLLATVVSAREHKPGLDFMPLSVEYKEKFSAVGRFPGGFLKREGRPSDNEILISRLVDRALRPLFPDDYHAETFVTINLISAEEDIMPDALAGLAASAALAVSDVPFGGPISEVRVAKIDGQLITNPTKSEIENAELDIMVGATYENVMMVEGEMNEVSEEDLIEAIKYAHEAIKKQCKAQIELAEEFGSTVKREYEHEEKDEQLKETIKEKTYKKLYDIALLGIADKHKRKEKIDEVKEEFLQKQYSEEELEEANSALINKYFHDVEKEAIRDAVLDKKVRLDGRKTTEIRPIWSEINYLPSTHGSAIFTRGETQSLTTVTLGSKMDEKMIDDALQNYKEKFTLHYNFPPFSTGDARPVRGVSRREVGHGNLAHRALKKVMPEKNPYTVRVVSDILESNGSSSMATVCAGTLALMDAGIQIKKPVSGIAMGLISDTKSDKYAILSDILGDEDHLGDMDFKVTGTADGITATQMDIKVDGLSYEILKEALMQAKEGRLHILNKLKETIQEPREELKPHTPRIETLEVPKDMIGAIIGPGGKNIQKLQEDTQTTIIIEEIDNVGIVEISSNNREGLVKAKTFIEKTIEKPEEGKVYSGIVKTITDFGAFVEILPNTEGLLHISEIDWARVEKVEDYLKEGKEIEVKLVGIDPRTKKMKLSRKALLPRPSKDNK